VEIIDRWLPAEFTQAQREYVKSVFRPVLGGLAIFEARGPVGSLTDLSGWFDNPRDRYLALKIIKNAISLITDKTKVEDAHFAYGQFIEIRYKDRKADPTAIQDVVAACGEMISIAPKVAHEMHRNYPSSPLPRHLGYWRLVHIQLDQGQYAEAISLMQQSNSQGWGDDYARLEATARGKIDRPTYHPAG
jgi:hypothetical protein